MKCPRTSAALSLALEMENDLAGSGRPTMLEKEDALVPTQQHLAIAHRNGKMGLRERALNMGRHVVGALGYMTVKDSILRRPRVEEVFQITHYIRIFVLLNEKRGGCVAQIERQQPRRNTPSFEPGHYVAGNLMQPLSGRGHAEAVLGDCPERRCCRHRMRIPTLLVAGHARLHQPGPGINTAGQIPSVVKAEKSREINGGEIRSRREGKEFNFSLTMPLLDIHGDP